MVEIQPNVPDDLSPYKIQSLPPNFYYIPNFLTPSESEYLLQKISTNRWTQLSHRRLQAHPSTLTKTNTLLSAPLPTYLTTFPPITERFSKIRIFKDTPHKSANHVLINEYKPGEGIMPHEDGGAYAHVVATISLGASIVLDIYDKRGDGDVENENEKGVRRRILQEPGSLLVTTGEAYTSLLHGIEEIERDEGLGEDGVVNWKLLGDKSKFEGGVNERGTRVSLTYRDVLKVSKVGIGILGRR
ncbi:hypothetical protein EJ08DRAFT_732783 [Tothia fuscella]|uniref:Fe2OG dioxygenase domain-containing protein n=1 Tax=Tothia fuscella TaxID=1048955 RepID=A0A9P4NV92_9PEZI|nr:hypothetical protein EJ08DRAFT_732783 [Tothia fuscella]